LPFDFVGRYEVVVWQLLFCGSIVVRFELGEYAWAETDSPECIVFIGIFTHII
jgi:hypothetical protein